MKDEARKQARAERRAEFERKRVEDPVGARKDMLRGFAVMGVVAAAVVAFAVFGGDDDEVRAAPERPDVPSEFGAEVACEDFVSDRLRSPSTADFSEQVRTPLAEDQFRVQGQVDSENGFGATVRAAWSCTVRAVPNGNDHDWELVDEVQIAQRQ